MMVDDAFPSTTMHFVRDDKATGTAAEQPTVTIGEDGTCRYGTGRTFHHAADAFYTASDHTGVAIGGQEGDRREG